MIFINYRHILKWFTHHRNTGYTYLLNAGMDKYDKPFIVACVDEAHKSLLKREVKNPNAIFITLNFFDKEIRGRDLPVLFDNHTLNVLFQDVEDGVADYQVWVKKQFEELIEDKWTAIKEMNGYQKSVEEIGWFRRVFKYKKTIKKLDKELDDKLYKIKPNV